MSKQSRDAELQGIFPDGLLIAVRPVGRELQAIRIDTGEDVTSIIRRYTRLKASKEDCGLRVKHTKTGGVQYRQVPMELVEREKKFHGNSPKVTASVSTAVAPIVAPIPGSADYTPMSDDDIREYVSRAMEFKPNHLIIPEVKWKYLCRSALRGKNILMVGPSGCGKTLAVQSIHETFADRPYFYFNLGASQDPRGMLIGNTHFDKDAGTFFADALFVTAIQTPGAIILLDEMSRAHDDASNILMTVLDENQRYLRIDEKPDTPTVPVAEGVTFLATANIGNEYTGARVMDRALLDRFIIIEMEALSKDDELTLLKMKFGQVAEKILVAIAGIASATRDEMKSDDPKVSTMISTRMSVEMAGLLNDGFSLGDAAEVCVYPFFDSAGGVESERTYMQQLVQKWLPTDSDGKDKPWDADDDDDSADSTKVPWQ